MAKLLRVFYGWAKINKIRKKEAISVIFENDGGFEKNEKKVKLYQNTVYTRFQTKKEMKDAEMSNRTFSEYSIFLDDKQIKGSLKKALEVNFLADKGKEKDLCPDAFTGLPENSQQSRNANGV